MSAASGVSRSMLSEIERKRCSPTLAVACRIAEAFGVPLSKLLDAPATPVIEVVRGDDRSFYYRADRDCRLRRLAPLHLDKSVEYFEIVLRPKGVMRSLPHESHARELLTVHQGSVVVRSAGDSAILQQSDSCCYPADVPHSIENTSENEAILFLVITYIHK